MTRLRNYRPGYKGPGLSAHHRIDSMDDIVSVLSRRIEAEDLLQLIEKFLARFLRDANSAIALNV